MKRVYFLGMILLVVLVGGCMGEEKSQQPVSPPAQSHPEFQYVEVESLPKPDLEHYLAQFFPENLAGLVGIPFLANSLEGELPAAGDPILSTAIITSIESKAGRLYIEPSDTTSMEVEYLVYKLSNATMAENALELYKRNWNREKWTYSGHDIWVWQGWEEQVRQGSPSRRAGMFISWDVDQNLALLPHQGVTPLVITKTKTDLYCLHGELAYGQYFIMIDVHASPAVVDTVARDIFAASLPVIFNATVNLTTEFNETERNVSVVTNVTTQGEIAKKEIEEIKENMIKLTELYLNESISYEEFATMFEIYKWKLEELESS
jgi:hypothetical protein